MMVDRQMGNLERPEVGYKNGFLEGKNTEMTWRDDSNIGRRVKPQTGGVLSLRVDAPKGVRGADILQAILTFLRLFVPEHEADLLSVYVPAPKGLSLGYWVVNFSAEPAVWAFTHQLPHFRYPDSDIIPGCVQYIDPQTKLPRGGIDLVRKYIKPGRVFWNQGGEFLRLHNEALIIGTLLQDAARERQLSERGA